MTRKAVRFALLALLALVAAAALFRQFVKVETLGPTEEPNVSQQVCDSNLTGVTVVIEFSNQKQSYCVTHQNQTGWDLLNQIGAKPQGTLQYPTGFVCKLFGYPTQQDCKDTPVATEGTWNYFYATAEQGDEWLYSPTGASMRKPNCGDVEAWVFEVPTSEQSANHPVSLPKPFACQ